MEYYPYDARNKLYRSHFGAVAAGTDLRLRLLLHNDARVHTAYLLISKDGEENIKYPLTPAETLEDYRFYEITLHLTEGLYFYCFSYESDYGYFFVTENEHSLGTVSDKGKKWQQTVYAADYKTPEWVKGGLIYQIFPDRFFEGNKKKEVPFGRFLKTDKTLTPDWEDDKICKDFYGGDLEGIRQKLPFLKDLGVSIIYLNPIFEAHSNHRYNTADYMNIDPLLGTEDDLKKLCRDAKKLGIYIVLDGVFSHTGDDSIYFNKYCRYNSLGAYQSQESPYYSWYKFGKTRDDYESWWGVKTLPETNENDPSFCEYITGENGVIAHYMRLGVMGWRLDVADELPDDFLDAVRRRIKTENPDGFLIGEVWEDATNKISYGKRRRYLLGNQLDSVMNYPLSNAIFDFVMGENSRVLIDTVLSQLENYPKPSLDCLMNHIGSHDTERALTRLSGKQANSRKEASVVTLSKDEYDRAATLLRLAAVLQYTLPGIPSLYYGDEAGMQGLSDPFCRGFYPWGNEDKSLTEFYKTLGKIRRENECFKCGDFVPHFSDLGYIVFERICDGCRVLIAVNRWCEDSVCSVPKIYEKGEILLGNPPDGEKLLIPAFGAVIIKA